MFERVFFDTNVWISGLLWCGKPYQCLLLARSGVVTAIVSPQILAELVEKLRHKFRLSEKRIQSGYKHLFSLGKYQETEIISPADLSVRLANAG